MKKLLFISSLLWSVAHGQTIPGYSTVNARYYWLSGAFRGLNIPAGGTAALYSGQWVKAGALFYDSTGTNKGLYVWDGSTWTLQGESKTFRQGVYDSSGIVGIGAGVKNKSVFTTDRRINTNGFELYLESRSSYILLGADSAVAGGASYITMRAPYGAAINMISDTSARTTNAIQWEKQGVLQMVIGNDIGPSTHHAFIDLYGSTTSVNLEAGGTAFAQFGVAAQYLALTAGGRLNIGPSGTIGGQTANVIGTLSASDSVLFTNIARVTDTTGFDVVMMNRTTGNHKKIYAGLIGGGGAAGLTVGTTTVTSGTTTRVLYDNAGVLGEYTVSGSGSVAMTTSPTFTTPALGTPSALVLTNATGLPVAGGGTGLATLTANYIPRGNGTSAFTNGADLTFDNNIFKVKAGSSGISSIRSEYWNASTIYIEMATDASGNGRINSQGADLAIQRSATNVLNVSVNTFSVLSGINMNVDANTLYVHATNNGVGFGTATPTSKAEFAAGSTTANTAPIEFNSGATETTIRSGLLQYNDQFYLSNVALNQLGMGGPIADFSTDVSNGTTVETDLYTYTTKANTLNATGERVIADYTVSLTDATADKVLKVYFAGTQIFTSGTLTSGVGIVRISVSVMRTGASTARAVVSGISPLLGAPITETDLTGLTFSGTNIIKITGTASGASGGSGDITAKIGGVFFWPASNN